MSINAKRGGYNLRSRARATIPGEFSTPLTHRLPSPVSANVQNGPIPPADEVQGQLLGAPERPRSPAARRPGVTYSQITARSASPDPVDAQHVDGTEVVPIRVESPLAAQYGSWLESASTPWGPTSGLSARVESVTDGSLTDPESKEGNKWTTVSHDGRHRGSTFKTAVDTEPTSSAQDGAHDKGKARMKSRWSKFNA